jgi:hypothetical protein
MHSTKPVALALTLLFTVALMGGSQFVMAAEKVTKSNLKVKITTANTADEHRAIAACYQAEAAKAKAKAQEHEQMAEWYRKDGEGTKKTPNAPGTIEHCGKTSHTVPSAGESI